MSSASKRNPIDRVIESTFEIGRIMRHRMKCEAKDNRINFLQIHALMLISEQDGITMHELADALHVTSPSATSFVNRLVKMQWLERMHDPHNRKLVRLRVTAKGKALLREKLMLRQKLMREFFSLLGAAEQASLAALHEKLIREYRRRAQS